MAKILVLGGYGLIGFPVVRKLLELGHNVQGVGRDIDFAAQQEPRCIWTKADISKLTQPEDWKAIVSGSDVIVNASGALQTGQKDNLEKVQSEAICALIDHCQSLPEPPSFVQISAPGADRSAELAFLSTKGIADDHLRGSSLSWIILKPGLVLSPTAYGGTALLRALASIPLVSLLVYAQSPVSTVHIDDLVDIVIAAAEGKVGSQVEVGVAERSSNTLTQLVAGFRSWLGYAPPLVSVNLPNWVSRVVGCVADGLGRVGWRSPLRSTSMRIMADGVVPDGDAYAIIMGRDCRSFEEALRTLPSTLQERWFARVFLLFPVILMVLSAFWMISGAVALLRLDSAADYLVAAGFGSALSKTIVVAGAILDLGLGVFALYRPTALKALWGMIATTFIYLMFGTVFNPSLWMDPLGPYVKTIPAAFLALVAASIVRSR